MLVVLVTAKNKQEARKISTSLINKRLAACVNIVNKVESFFWWQGKVDNQCEALLIIKTNKSLFERLRKEVKRVHSYDVPEIIALPVVKSDADYRKWVNDVTG